MLTLGGNRIMRPKTGFVNRGGNMRIKGLLPEELAKPEGMTWAAL